MYGSNRLTAHTSSAAFSRLVDRRHVVTNPDRDWAAGRLQKDNTAREEDYIRDIERICERDRIDTIFPSYDSKVYVLAKNRQRLADRGVQVVTPDYETLIPLLDKSRTLKLAAAAGFPHPETYRVEEHELSDLARRIPPPWVVRPTSSAGGRGMELVRRAQDLGPTVARLQQDYSSLIFQEYIPGNLKQNFYLMIDRDNRVLSMIAPRVLRTSHRVYRSSSAAVLFNHHHELAERVSELVRPLHWHGGLTVQTKIDARDGTPKLMEINPRMGSHTWFATEMGINLPLLQLHSFQGKPVEPVTDYPGEALMLEPAEDFIGVLFKLIDRGAFQVGRLLGRRTIDPESIPASVFDMVSALSRDYFGQHRKVYSPQFRHALTDPMVFILKCWAVLRYELNQLKRAGI